MNENLKQALDFAKYRQTFALQQKTLKEKINAKLTMGVNGGIFKIDRTLLTFVQLLLDQGRTSGVPIFDLNDNPILIDDLEKFRDEIFDRYFSSSLEYYEEYQALKKKRSVAKLTDHE